MVARVTTRRWLLRDSRQTFVLLVWAAFAASILFYFADWPVIHRDTRAQASSKQTNNAGQDDPDVIYTGVILLPTRGRQCREAAFDNRDGRMIDKGLVDCSHARVQAGAQNQQVGIEYARLRAIGKAFNR